MNIRTLTWMPAFLFFATPAFAAPTLQTQIDALQQQVQALQSQMNAPQNAGSNNAGSPANSPASAPVTASYDKKGFVLNTADGENEFRVRGFMQADSRWYGGDNDAADTFVMRRVRITFDGTVGKYYGYFLQPAFDGGAASLQDAYWDANYADAFKLRFGRFKVPLGLDYLRSSQNTALTEAGFPTRLTPGYETGVQLFGTVCNGTTDYQFAVLNGASQEGQEIDSDTNDDKAIAVRVFSHVFKNAGLETLKGLGVGAAYMQSEPNAGAHPDYTALPGLTIDDYANVVFAPEKVERFVPQGYWYYKQFGVLAEYLSLKQTLMRAGGSPTSARQVNNTAWQALFTWVLTGEDATYNAGVTPNSPFLKDGALSGNAGAIELVARYSVLNVDNANFIGTPANRFLDPDTSVRRAQNAGFSVNWYLAYNAKLQFNYDAFSYRGGAPNGADREDDHTFFTRVQLAF